MPKTNDCRGRDTTDTTTPSYKLWLGTPKSFANIATVVELASVMMGCFSLVVLMLLIGGGRTSTAARLHPTGQDQVLHDVLYIPYSD